MSFKRADGTVVGSTGPKVLERVEVLSIAKLLPLEGAVVGRTLQKYRTEIRDGQDLAPPKVVEVGDGNYLVTDGNHRAYAAKLEGMSELSVRIVDSGTQKEFHLNEARHAARRGRLNFENIRQVDSDDARKEFTKAEAEENEKDDFLAGLTSM